MGTPLSLNSKLLSLFTKSFNVLVDIKSEWQANKGVILYLWDAIDYSDLEQLVRMYFLGTFHQNGNYCTGTCQLQWGIHAHNASKGFPRTFYFSTRKCASCMPYQHWHFFSWSSSQAGSETYCFRFTEKILLVSWRSCWLSSHLLRSWSQTQHDCRCTAGTGRFGMLTHS